MPSSRVFVNSHIVPTTPNLRRALKHLERGTFNWIDAICIDQGDDKERGNQVRLMTEIYRHAGAVVVWLGSEKRNSASGMALLNDLGDFIDAERNANNFAAKLYDWIYKTLSDHAYDTRWKGLKQIYSRSYWTRLWVIQELVITTHPDKVRLLCGPDKAQFNHLRILSRKISDIAAAIPRFYRREPLDATIWKLKDAGKRVRNIAVHVEAWASSNAKGISIVRLLERYHKLRCADPRDKVYALLGMSKDYLDIDVDYSERSTSSEVFKATTRKLIEKSRNLDVLMGAGSRSEDNIPSWVLDFSKPATYQSRVICSFRKKFSATKGSSIFDYTQSPLCNEPSSLTTLSLRGKSFGIVTEVLSSGLDLEENDNITLFNYVIQESTENSPSSISTPFNSSWGPNDIQVGDEIVLLMGGSVPFVLREANDGREGFSFIGSCLLIDSEIVNKNGMLDTRENEGYTDMKDEGYSDIMYGSAWEGEESDELVDFLLL